MTSTDVGGMTNYVVMYEDVITGYMTYFQDIEDSLR